MNYNDAFSTTGFNFGTITVTSDSINIQKIFGENTIERHKIMSIEYLYDNFIYKIIKIPLAVFYVFTIIGIPFGLRFFRGDIRAHVKMVNNDTVYFWIPGPDKKNFKKALG